MNTTADFEEFLTAFRARLARGREAYGDRSFGRPVEQTMLEILEEQVDQIGWTYVLWCQAAALRGHTDQAVLAEKFEFELRLRLLSPTTAPTYNAGNLSLPSLMERLLQLAVHLYLQGQALRRRLLPIVRALELTTPEPAALPPEGGTGNP